MTIKMSSIMPIENPKEYKLHLACWNGEVQPLDDYISDWKAWEGWNTWRSSKDDFSRNYIFSLIDFYHEKDTWLFGGIFEIISREPINNSHSYKIKLLPNTKEFIGRLKISFKRPARVKAVLFEKYYSDLVVSEILKEKYTGETFCGYENIDHSFKSLENIIKNEKLDWKGALENIKGVYLITDKSNGKRYVGSAYGTDGIWSRWSCYIETGHGWTDELTKIIETKGKQYARDNFNFSILETMSMGTDKDIIIKREHYWMNVLMSRDCRYGYNKN